MRVEKVNWGPTNKIVATETRKRARKAAKIVLAEALKNCPVGTVSHPMYITGKYAGQPWTKLDAGQLKKTGRITEKKDLGHGGYALHDIGGVRIIFGDYFSWYAAIVEHYTPYVRPAVEATRHEVNNIMENG